jgi:uncharacterized protein (DUF1697 family)
METYLALLRGINVTGRNKLPMKELAAMFEDVGCSDVRTYIQSGNVVFTAPATLARRIPTLMNEAIGEQFGYDIPVVLRRASELADIVAANPFAGRGIDAKQLHVAFLADAPDGDAIAELDPQRSPPDEFVVVGGQIYLRLPAGMARTKLTNAYFDRVLDTVSTMRNWRTTKKLLELSTG